MRLRETERERVRRAREEDNEKKERKAVRKKQERQRGEKKWQKREKNNKKQKRGATELTWLGWAVLDEEEIGQGVVVWGQALLVQLQLAKALALLVLDGARVLHQVQLGLGGVVTQGTVVQAGLRATSALLLLQMLPKVRK